MTDFNPDDWDEELPPIDGITGPVHPAHPSNGGFDPDDDEGDTINPGEGFMELMLKMQNADDDLRQIGLYVEAVMPHPRPDGEGFIGIIACTVGDVAFTDRVQHPEKFMVDKTVANMEHDGERDEFLDKRARMQRNILAGRKPLDDGPEGDSDDD